MQETEGPTQTLEDEKIPLHVAEESDVKDASISFLSVFKKYPIAEKISSKEREYVFALEEKSS